MDATLVTLVQSQAGNEMLASWTYSALRYWADTEEYGGSEEWFAEAAKEERKHARRCLNLLSGYARIQPTMPDLPKMILKRPSLLAAFRDVLKLEQQNTEQWSRIKGKAQELGDHAVESWASPMRRDQIDSVSEVGDIVKRLERARDDVAAIESADAWIGKHA